MPDPTPAADSTPGEATPAPAENPQPPAGTATAKPTLEESLASLDDSTRAFVLGEVHKARTEAQGLRVRLKDAEPKVQAYDALEEASRSDLEKAQAAAIEATRRADELQARAVQAEIKAAAAGKFADPSDAAAFLTGDYTGENSEIDTARITADLDALLTRKPHLAKVAGPRAPQPDPTLGAGNGTGGVSLDDRIKQAQKDGRWGEVMHLQNQKLAKSMK